MLSELFWRVNDVDSVTIAARCSMRFKDPDPFEIRAVQ